MPVKPAAGGAREQLVSHALELLHRDHPEDLSIREVARRAGVSSGAPYHHFGDKPGLLAACARVGWEVLIARLEELDDASGIEQQLGHCADIYLDYALGNAGCYRLMMSRLFYDVERYRELDELRARAMGGVIARIERSGVVGDDPALLRARGIGLWSMLHGYAILRLDGSVKGVPTPQQQRDELVALAIRMALLSP
ncbi:TetR/AcrR family transcriptional regulator [Haliangium ochraceum]|uniref:Transcriptional regulator, TetR family n=1 Tax=Haliangium ochraceum (strain DSM 14365 / JCM 11303 / SMP-2) TaxID=502025 RepID=D0LLB6_HALO1|nr:TetR/AcrR family transcriptional regulator [Haliangium ochraceum]ACY18612.1 transcriptional regulator, TetR family [Haliangium ochraceum DSM 14365]